MQRLAQVALAIGASVLVLSGLAAAFVFLDFDGDGLANLKELKASTQVLDEDSDGDGLSDGRERKTGTDPLQSDSDDDGIDDRREGRLRTDALKADSDGDGLDDRAEHEAGLDPRNGDSDGDGVPDGSDRDAQCALERCAQASACAGCDGDQDKVADALERLLGLDTGTADSDLDGILDAAVIERTHPDGALVDTDADGIPDAWEEDDSVGWCGLEPKAGRKDLLVEFLRYDTPRTKELGLGSYEGAYGLVAEALEGYGIHLGWTETTLMLQEGESVPWDPSTGDEEFGPVVRATACFGNPFVVLVVMTPEVHGRSGWVAGVGVVGSKLSIVDVGAHVDFTFSGGGGSITATPSVDGLLREGRSDALRERYKSYFGGDSGAFRTVTESSGSVFTVSWEGPWFERATAQVEAHGTVQELTLEPFRLQELRLAATILHEVGHNMGLCHPHEPDCAAGLPEGERARQSESVMSYDQKEPALVFLPTEQRRFAEGLACTPRAAINVPAFYGQGAEYLASRYGIGTFAWSTTLPMEVAGPAFRLCGQP